MITPQRIDYPSGVGTIAAGGYTAGSGFVNLSSGQGALFGSPSSGSPLRFTLASSTTPSTCTHYSATGITGDQITGVTVLDGTDRNYLAGDTVAARTYAQDWLDVYSAIAAGGSGTVTSVALAAPNIFSVSGSPVTTSGTLTLSLVNQSAATVFCGPIVGGGTAPAFRALAASDIPSLPASIITTSQLATARGGTGLDGSGATNGQLLIGNGSGFALSAITAGAGIKVTNGVGSITIAEIDAVEPTSVKTGAYNAQAGDLVPVDCSSGSVTITLPTAPADRSWVCVKLIATSGSNTCTVAAGGSDVFDKTSGPTTKSLSVTNESSLFQYLASSAIWYKLAADNSGGGYAAGSGITITTSGGSRTIAATSTGTVTSVTFTGDGTVLSSTPSSAVTTSGTLTAGLNNQNANIVLAGPTSGSAAAPTFRGLVTADLPTGLRELLFQQVTDQTVANTSGYSSLINTTNARGSVTIPAGALNGQGKSLFIEFSGYVSTASSSPGAVAANLKLGGSLIGTTLSSGQATSASNKPISGWLTVVCRTTGSSGTINVSGNIFQIEGSFWNGANGRSMANGTTSGTQAATTDTTVNLTNSLALDFGFNYVSAVSGNSITVNQLSIWLVP